MNHESHAFQLTCRDPRAPVPVLLGVQAHGRLDGVLFELTLRQRYRNDGDRPLEVVYTFPLTPQAVLMGMACEWNGERLKGTAVPRRDAERRYEEALEDGDAPMLLEVLEDGLHTVNIGNLLPGDEIVLEVRYAQALAFEQGRLRISIPTTIAPRYGSPVLSGLQPQQVPMASLLAEYPLELSVTVAGSLARGRVECPTHQTLSERVGADLRLDLADASLDRDVVLVVEPVEPWPSFMLRAEDAVADGDWDVALAALRPHPGLPRPHVALKLLVDCSGSMAGDSIMSARVALQRLVAGLTEHDHVSLSRFGSTAEPVYAMSLATPRTRRHLHAAIESIDANLGGTEMEAALQFVFERSLPPGCTDGDVLLVTDGQVWEADAILAAACASGHRIFAIGVGSAPAEGMLRQLAEGTGGACELAAPGEALEAAASRMMARIRQRPWRRPHVDWGVEPVWQTPLPAAVFGGDTVLAFAGLPRGKATGPLRLLADDDSGATVVVARSETEATCVDSSLPRLAAARRVTMLDEPAARDLAVAYGLVGPHTHYLLVQTRQEGDKQARAAQLHRVDSMLAAGWGATGRSVFETRAIPYGSDSQLTWEEAASVRACMPARPHTRLKEVVRPVAAARGQGALRPHLTLREFAAAIVEYVARSNSTLGLAAQCHANGVHPKVRWAIDRLVRHGVDADHAWLLLAHWTDARPRGLADDAMSKTLRQHVEALDASLVAAAVALLEHELGGSPNDGWTRLRTSQVLPPSAMSEPLAGLEWN